MRRNRRKIDKTDNSPPKMMYSGYRPYYMYQPQSFGPYMQPDPRHLPRSVSSLSLGDLGLECLLSEDFDSGDSDSRRFGRRRLANCGYIGLGYGYGYGPLITTTNWHTSTNA
jgi:hypothetical protein